MELQISEIQARDRAAATRVLAEAFSDNPAYIWAFPAEAKRPEKFYWFMQKVLALGMTNGLNLKIGSADAVALWFEPGKTVGWVNLIQAGLYELPFRLGITTYLRIQSILNQNRKFMDQIMGKTEHFYLFHLAVAPALQGKGLGSALIRAVTEKADRLKVPCFLETDRTKNLPLYEKHGFKIHASAELAEGVPLWYLRREPRLPATPE